MSFIVGAILVEDYEIKKKKQYTRSNIDRTGNY